MGGSGVATLGDGSALGAVRSAGWPALRVGWLQYLAALSALGDLLTTAVILSSEAYGEYNSLLVALAGDSLALALGYFLLLNLWYLGLGVLDLGWVSTASATYQVAVMGSATVSNLVLFASGISLLGVLGGSLVYEARSWVAVALALAVVARHHGRPPLREALAVAVLYGVGEVLL